MEGEYGSNMASNMEGRLRKGHLVGKLESNRSTQNLN